MPGDPFASMSIEEILEQVAVAEADWSGRHNVVRDLRDLRYGKDDVLNTIPEELRATDFEYHSPELDEAVTDLTAFLSASELTFSVRPSKDSEARTANTIEDVLMGVFGQDGVLEEEAGEPQAWQVWENAVENGTGCFKFHLKRDYALRSPTIRFADELDDLDPDDFEPNPDYTGRDRKETREERGTAKYRETGDSLEKRRKEFDENEFAWQWRSVDARTLFAIYQDSVPIAVGEINSRPATILSDHEMTVDEDEYIYLGQPSPKNARQQSSNRPVVDTFELWSATRGWFGFLSHSKNDAGKRKAVLSQKDKVRTWRHPYGRPPYFFAYGLKGTDSDRAWQWQGAFYRLSQEIPLLNHLETMHFNAVHRGYFPLYYPVKDHSRDDVTPLDNMESMTGIGRADMERTELPPGWRWEVMPTGFEPDLTAQLEASRERVRDSAVSAVLQGKSPGAGDSGAKISLLINAAGRALSPFVRNMSHTYMEMAQCFLRTCKLSGLDTSLYREESQPSGQIFAKRVNLKSSDIVSTNVTARLNMQLPIDKAAEEVRGITLIDSGKMSYRSAAQSYFGITDAEQELDKIRLERRDAQIDDVAFAAAQQQFMQAMPAEFAKFIGQQAPLPRQSAAVGGGPNGAYGGATAELGRGSSSLPNAIQMDNGVTPGA